MSSISKRFLKTPLMPYRLPDLVQSFSKLLLDVSGNVNTLNKFQDMLSDEIERALNSDVTPSLFRNC